MNATEFWFHHGGVSVPNLDAAVAWYERVLGFKVLYRTTIPTIPADMAMLENGNLHFELFEAQNAAPASKQRSYPDTDVLIHGNKHVSFACEDVKALAEKLRGRRADIVWVKEFPDGRANLFLRDNAGNLIEFIQEKKRAPAVSRV